MQHEDNSSRPLKENHNAVETLIIAFHFNSSGIFQIFFRSEPDDGSR